VNENGITYSFCLWELGMFSFASKDLLGEYAVLMQA